VGADHKNRLKTCRVSTRAQRVIFITLYIYIYILSGVCWSYTAAGSKEEKKWTQASTTNVVRKNPINLIALRRGKQSHIFPFFSSSLPVQLSGSTNTNTHYALYYLSYSKGRFFVCFCNRLTRTPRGKRS